jgi:hypothetical protein
VFTFCLRRQEKKHSRGQCYKTFYRGNLPPFHGNTVILCYKAILPWKYCGMAVNKKGILTQEKVGLEESR